MIWMYFLSTTKNWAKYTASDSSSAPLYILKKRSVGNTSFCSQASFSCEAASCFSGSVWVKNFCIVNSLSLFSAEPVSLFRSRILYTENLAWDQPFSKKFYIGKTLGDLMTRQAPSQSRLAPPALSSREYARSRSAED